MAAVIALVSTNWGTFSSVAKVTILGVPVIALYLAGFATRSQAHFSEVSTVSLVTANLAFPFVLGVAIFELAGAPAIDGGFMALVSGISFLWFCIVEFMLKVRQNSFLTYTALAAWVVSTGSTLPNTPFFVDLVFIGIGLITLLGVHLVVPGEEGRRQLRTYLMLGALSFFTTVFTLDGSIRSSFGEYTSTTSPLAIDVVVILSYAFLGFLGIMVAVTAAKQWKDLGERMYGELRLVSEQSLLLLAAIPTTLIATSLGLEDAIPQILIALLVSTSSLVFAVRLKLKTTTTVSWFTTGILIAQLLFAAFSAAEISWPVLVLIIGSLLFVLAFVLSARSRKHPVPATPSEIPYQPLWGLCEPLPPIGGPNAPAVNEVVRADGTTVRFVQESKEHAEHYLTSFILQGILFLLVIRLVLPSVLGVI